MPVMDEFKEEREAIKHGTLKQKLAYFADYYKWHLIITVAVIAAVTSFIVHVVTQKDTALYLCMLNVTAWSTTIASEGHMTPEEYAAGFAEYAGIDTDKYNIQVDTSLQINPDSLDENTIFGSQKFMTYLAAAEMDVIVTDEDSLEHYAYQNNFHDLRDILTPEQLEKYEPYFYYIDMAVVEDRAAYMEDINNMADSYVLEIENARDPKTMEKPVPVGIYLDNCDDLRDPFYFPGDDVIACVFANTTRPETAVQYLDYLMRDI